MSRSIRLLCVAWAWPLAGLCAAQEPSPELPAHPPATAAAAPSDPEAIKLHLMDGSTICGKLSVKEIEVETPFGNLLVPVTAIVSFTPGLGSHPAVARDLSALIEDLGSSNFSRREAAQKKLLELGLVVRGELERHADDPDTERRARIKELLEELDRMEEELADTEDHDGWSGYVLIDKDTVVTTDFTVVGSIVPQSFTIESQYGPLTVQLADIRRGERDIGQSEIRKTLRVEGRHIAQLNMLSTRVRLERGDEVSLAADGTITMTPWGNEAQSTPEGAANFGWYIPNQIAMGALVARIGNGGPIFKVGSRHSFTADRSGVLYLGFALQGDYANNNYQFPGEYKVKLRVQPK